jgi:DNA polymerase
MATAEQTRLAYLDAMGVQAWRLRMAPPFAGQADLAAEDASHSSPLPAGEGPGVGESISANVNEPTASAHNADSPTSPAQENGATWVAEPEQVELRMPTEPTPHPASVLAAPNKLAETLQNCDLAELQAQVQACVRCSLHETRTQTVFGVGNPKADWLVIGEAPGEQEDLQGEPFVGRAGLLLNEMLRAIGFPRETVYIANILKCRPPKNRDPQPDEAAACEGYLKRQIVLIQPKIILAVGRISAQNLLKTTTPIGKLRGIVHDYQGVPLVVTYHPAYLLRSPLEKRNAFDDLRLALRTYRQKH